MVPRVREARPVARRLLVRDGRHGSAVSLGTQFLDDAVDRGCGSGLVLLLLVLRCADSASLLRVGCVCVVPSKPARREAAARGPAVWPPVEENGALPKSTRGGTTCETTVAVVANANVGVIHCVLDARAGKIPIPPNGVLHVNKMREHLIPLPYTNSKDTKKKKRFNVHLIAQTFGSVSVVRLF